MPQLQAFFQKAEMDTQLAHRDQFEHINGIFRDIFDGHWYHKLWRTHVVIDGVQQPHKFFSGKNDITLLLSTDGFLLFNRRRSGPSATPMLLQNLNLPLTLRTHLEHLICIGVIPRPHQPKDLRSFLTSLDNECTTLADGVHTYDALDEDSFYL